MKRLYFLSVFLLLFVFSTSKSQDYCPIESAQAYSLNMPGISQFTLNAIARSSSSLECGATGCNSYVQTGLSTTLEQGATYTVSITHTRDEIIFPDARNNIRIWIDYNGNGTYDVETETAVSMDFQAAGTTTSTFQVPIDAAIGTTGMRITAKMSSDAGHTLPSPCDDPADPLGYHGEIEDYEVVITQPSTSVQSENLTTNLLISPNPATSTLHVVVSDRFAMGRLILINAVGAELLREEKLQSSSVDVDIAGLPSGVYWLIVQSQAGTMMTAQYSIFR